MSSFTIGWPPGTTPSSGDGAGDSGFLISIGHLAGGGSTLPSPAPIVSMSIYVFATPGGNVLMGIYDNTGTAGKAGALKASCPSTALSAGWNTVKINPNVLLTSGTYWLVFIVNSNTPNIGKGVGAGPIWYLGGQTFSLPSTAPNLTSTTATFEYGIYATFDVLDM